MAADVRFRRARYARFVDDPAKLDEMEQAHADLSLEEQIDRNAWVDSVADDDLKRDLGIEVAADEEPSRSGRRSKHPRPTARVGGDDDGNG